MPDNDSTPAEPRPAGYAALLDRLGLEVIPNWHRSLVAAGNSSRIASANGMVEQTYPSTYWPGDTLGDHLEFALKYDGTNLGILASLFAVADPSEIQRYIESKPTGKYTRRIWFLYEFLSGATLPLADLTQGNYVDLLDPAQYFTVATTRRIKRRGLVTSVTRSACDQ
jgi:hypothetical protein